MRPNDEEALVLSSNESARKFSFQRLLMLIQALQQNATELK
jgi:hypothetical protein